MKHALFIPAAIALFSVASCNSPAPSGDNAAPKADTAAKMSDNKAERNRKTIMESMDAFNAHNAEGVLKNCAPNFMEYMDGSIPPQKLDSAKIGLAGYLNAFPDVKGENMTYISDGDKVVVVTDWTQTFKNDMMGMKATGKTVKYRDVDIFTFDNDGKVMSHRSIYPMGAILAMAGADMSKMPGMDKDMKKEGSKKK
jgi:predicted ester cyclase